MRLPLWIRLLNKLSNAQRRAYAITAKNRLAACGSNVYLSPDCIIWPESSVRVGNNVEIHSFTHIFGSGGVEIEDNVLISASCSITSVTHPLEASLRHQLIKLPVIIEADVWIGTGAIILPGVRVGRGSVVAAGAVVVKSVPRDVVVAGVPAVTIRALNSES